MRALDRFRAIAGLALPAPEKAVLYALAVCSDDGGLSWPSIGRLAHMAGVHDRTAQRLLQKLEKASLIGRTVRHGRSTLVTIRDDMFSIAPPGTQSPPADDRHRRTTHPPPAHDSPTPGARSPRSAQGTAQGTGGEETTPVPPVAQRHHEAESPRTTPEGQDLPDGWRPSEEIQQKLRRGERVDPLASLSNFVAYFRSITGPRRLSRDWNARYELWVLEDIQKGRLVREVGSASGMSPRKEPLRLGDASDIAEAAKLARAALTGLENVDLKNQRKTGGGE